MALDEDEVRPTPAPVALVRDPRFLLHDTGAHVETPRRLQAVGAYLRETGLDALPTIAPRPATDDELLAVHTPRHLAYLTKLDRQGGGFIDADTVMSAHSESVGRLAAGGALAAVDAVVSGAAKTALVIARPPGHHAMSERAMGFCLYNNVAVAARYVQARHGLRRVLILDWDVHHGNGTQEIFDADASVLFVSIHQFPLWPPGWGWLDQIGSDDGQGYTVNFPMPPGDGDDTYKLICDDAIASIAASFKPDLVLVSAGQDCHIADPISSMGLTADGFAMLTRAAKRIAASSGAYGPILLLEGGYNPMTLPYLVGSIIGALGDLDVKIDDPYARALPISSEARRRVALVRRTLSPWWALS